MLRIRCFAAVVSLAVALAACDSVDPLGSLSADLAGDSLDVVLEQASLGGQMSGQVRAGEVQGREEAGEDEREADRSSPSTGVALFDRLAAEIPGFGGLYRVRQCSVVVVLTAAADREQAFAVVRRTLVPLMGRPCADNLSLRAELGEFTYLELKRYLFAARPLLDLRGVHSMRIDFQLNRLVIEVASREVAHAVMERLAEIGVPRSAVVFRAATRH